MISCVSMKGHAGVEMLNLFFVQFLILSSEVGALKSDGESKTANCDEVKQTWRIGPDADDTSDLCAATERL